MLFVVHKEMEYWGKEQSKDTSICLNDVGKNYCFKSINPEPYLQCDTQILYRCDLFEYW